MLVHLSKITDVIVHLIIDFPDVLPKILCAQSIFLVIDVKRQLCDMSHITMVFC